MNICAGVKLDAGPCFSTTGGVRSSQNFPSRACKDPKTAVGKLFSTRTAVTNFNFLRPAQYVAKAFSKLDCHAIKMKNMLKYFENIIHPQYGKHVYNAFIRYQATRKGK